MVVCQYFLRGQCKFGNQCRNEHPRDAQRPAGFANANQTWNSAAQSRSPAPQLFTVDSMTRDLDAKAEKSDKPIWPLSSYGPAKLQMNLLPGLDESPEELRVKAFLAAKAGTTIEYMKYEADKTVAAEQTFTNARANIQQAYEQALRNLDSQAPSSTSSIGSAVNSGSAFGSPTSTTMFGKPSGAFGSTTAAPAFGRPSALGATAATSPFGQPSFGQTAFGKPPQAPSAFGQLAQGISAFGQPVQGTSAFGQLAQGTSAFAQPIQGTSAFGQPAQGPTTSAFGQPAQGAVKSAFGQVQQPSTSAFMQPAQGSTTPAFGQSSLIKPASGAFGSTSITGGAFSNLSSSAASGSSSGGAFSAFAGPQPSAFGLAAAAGTPPSNTGGSVFGQPSLGSTTPASSPSAFGGAATATPAFGSTSAFGALANKGTTSAFGTPAAAVTSAFGGSGVAQPATTSAFGALASGQPVSAFGAQPTTSAFGPSASITGAFGSPAQPQSAFGASQQGNQPVSVFASEKPVSAFASTTPQQPTSAFASGATGTQPSAPKITSGKIDFAAARANVKSKPGLDKYDALLPENYMQLLPQTAIEAFKAEKFEWGQIPEFVPPIELR